MSGGGGLTSRLTSSVLGWNTEGSAARQGKLNEQVARVNASLSRVRRESAEHEMERLAKESVGLAWRTRSSMRLVSDAWNRFEEAELIRENKYSALKSTYLTKCRPLELQLGLRESGCKTVYNEAIQEFLARRTRPKCLFGEIGQLNVDTDYQPSWWDTLRYWWPLQSS